MVTLRFLSDLEDVSTVLPHYSAYDTLHRVPLAAMLLSRDNRTWMLTGTRVTKGNSNLIIF